MWSNEEATNHTLSAELLDSLILCDILITRLDEPGQTKKRVILYQFYSSVTLKLHVSLHPYRYGIFLVLHLTWKKNRKGKSKKIKNRKGKTKKITYDRCRQVHNHQQLWIQRHLSVGTKCTLTIHKNPRVSALSLTPQVLARNKLDFYLIFFCSVMQKCHIYKR